MGLTVFNGLFFTFILSIRNIPSNIVNPTKYYYESKQHYASHKKISDIITHVTPNTINWCNGLTHFGVLVNVELKLDQAQGPRGFLGQ